jgi:hypothetical protein
MEVSFFAALRKGEFARKIKTLLQHGRLENVLAHLQQKDRLADQESA